MDNILAVSIPKSNTVFSNTLSLLTLTLIPTIIGAGISLMIPAAWFAANAIMFMLLMIGGSIGAIIGVYVYKNDVKGIAFLLAFTALAGLGLGPLLNAALSMSNGGSLILMAGGLTATAMFAVTTYVKNTKRDFSFMGGFLFAGLIILLVASVIGIFVQSTVLHLVIASASALLFTGYLLYDTSRVINGHEDNYVLATLSIYIDLLNIFSSLLRLLIAFGGKDE